MSPTIDVVLYQQPHHRLSFDVDEITESDWPDYPVGDQILSIEGYELDTGVPTEGEFDSSGWWSLAQHMPAFPGRIGGAIDPFAVVVHTTDMVPEDFGALLQGWTTALGKGDCAHFVIGRDADDGVVQLVPITNNANHAGSDSLSHPHGWFLVPGQQPKHPNSVSVGIELHCAGGWWGAGGVKQINGAWRFMENGAPHGAAIPDSDVIPDPQHPGLGWHTVTDYQYQQLDLLLRGLEAALAPLPQGCVAQSVSQQPEAWAIFPTGRRVGHVSLDAYNRSDPWPPTCDWLRTWI
jgi:hypothetical protein